MKQLPPQQVRLHCSRKLNAVLVFFTMKEGTFRPERVKVIAERFGMDPDGVLDNIVVARAYTHEHQMGEASRQKWGGGLGLGLWRYSLVAVHFYNFQFVRGRFIA